ncbi:MAG: hypothetical protein CM15mP100_4320 [Alphaproteobacteria bacterium]|nr:MAG: hypothetical protein CM15mP100_4320 [Alphaproteobacteria bacterium]
MREIKTMAVPKSKISKSKRDMRRAHDSIKSDAYVEDKVTGELHRPHHIDLKTVCMVVSRFLRSKTGSESSGCLMTKTKPTHKPFILYW